ncbi:MAG: hypothetical protein RML35_04485 [Chloroherpetonaceae bacterium]|nr:hypothetical protein [Chloroherpetonaceae bacterium]
MSELQFSSAYSGFVLATSLALLAWLFWREWQRPERRHLLWRLLATFLAVLSLSMLALQPSRVLRVPATEAVLLTEGFSLSRLTRFLDTAQVSHIFALGPSVWQSLQDSARVEHTLRITPVPDLAFLHRHFPDVHKLIVFGWGFEHSDTTDLAPFNISLLLADVPSGFRWISVPPSVSFGQPVFVRGLYYQASGEATMLCFASASQILDSLPLQPIGNTRFEFSTTPKQTGQYLYTLFSRTASGDTLWQEVVPISVVPADTITVLLIESAPNFETRQLKAWLAARGNHVASRTTISKENTFSEFLNLSARSLNALTETLLQDFDVLLLDASSLATLSAGECIALRRAIENGLGVFLFLNDAAELKRISSEWLRLFGVPAAATVPDDLHDAKVHIRDFPVSDVPPLPAVTALLRSDGRSKVLAHDAAERPLAIAKVHGLGHLGCSTVQDTYRWALAGRSELYAAYWLTILKNLARPNATQPEWRLLTVLPVVDQPLMLELRTLAPFPISVVRAGTMQDSLFLIQDLHEPTIWRGTFWARQAGWHAISDGRYTMWFYVFDKTARIAQRALVRHAFTQHYTNFLRPQAHRPPQVVQRRVALPLWPFLLLFVAAVGYLWAERKVLF